MTTQNVYVDDRELRVVVFCFWNGESIDWIKTMFVWLKRNRVSVQMMINCYRIKADICQIYPHVHTSFNGECKRETGGERETERNQACESSRLCHLLQCL